jgi:hypothetical protein
MTSQTSRLRIVLTCAFTIGALFTSTAGAQQVSGQLAVGETAALGGLKVTLKKLDALPYVESDYTKRFKFDSADNPKLKELRECYKLDEVVATGRDEFDKQVLLMDWTHRQFKKFGKPSANSKGALEILKAIGEGHTFFCAHFAQVFVSSAASMGWVDRELALRRHQGVAAGGSTEHSSTEIWSNQYRKWVMLDPTSNMYLEKDGVPLNGFEIRQEWFYHNGTNLVFVIGKERKKYKKSDLPIILGRYAGFGVLAISPDELDKYGFTAYIPNTNLMDAREDYEKMFIFKDKLCDGTKWHTRTVPANPAVDPYFPIGQVWPTIVPGGGNPNGQYAFKRDGTKAFLPPNGENILIKLKTLTPNFKEYQVRLNRKEWRAMTSDSIVLNIQPDIYRLEMKTVNQFGVEGPVSTVEIEVTR